MCNIGRIKRIIANEEKPITAMEAIITAIPIKVKELVHVKRIQGVESKGDNRPADSGIPSSHK